MAQPRRSSARSGTFLLELIIVILFFSVASAICVSLFVQARLESRQSQALSAADLQCRSAAECVRSVGSDPGALTQLLGGGAWQDGFAVSYNADFKPVDNAAPAARYRMTIRFSQQSGSGLLNAKIDYLSLDQPDTPVYTLDTTFYRP